MIRRWHSVLTFVALVSLAAVAARAQDVALPPTTITATSATSTEIKHFMAEVRYDYTLYNDLRHNSLSAAASPNAIGANLAGMRMLGSLYYSPVMGVALGAYLGMAPLNVLNVSARNATTGIEQSVQLDTSVVYGASARVDLFPMWRFHLAPSFRFLRTDYSGIRGTLSNPDLACNYDFSSNSASTCLTPGQNTGGGVILARFSQNEFLFRLEMGVDIGGEINQPVVGFYVGAEEAVQIAQGNFAYSIPSVGTTVETYTFTSQRTEGVYVSLRSAPGPVRIQFDARGLAATQFSGMVGIVF